MRLSAYGAAVSLTLPEAGMLDELAGGLARAWTIAPGPSPAGGVVESYMVHSESRGYYAIHDGSGGQTLCADRQVAASLLGKMMRQAVGTSLPDLTCVHASVVTHRGRALMLPARAMAGTTTLVRALQAAGAALHSEEFALIDRHGRVLSDIGLADAAVDAVELALVAMTVYRPGAAWTPARVAYGEAVVALFAHTVGAQARPADTLATLRRALEQIPVLEGDRGEAAQTAEALLVATENGVV